MLPFILSILRSNAVYITLPVAAVIGVIGYAVENLVSDKYTPYNDSIQDLRIERLVNEEVLEDTTNKLQGNVLERNLSPSLMLKNGSKSSEK